MNKHKFHTSTSFYVPINFGCCDFYFKISGSSAMLSTVGITQFYKASKKPTRCSIKQEIEDFVVQEVTGGRVCQVAPLINLEKFHQAEHLLNNLPQDLNKVGRRNVYKTANYHPFRMLVTKDCQFVVEDCSEDIFVFTVMKYNYSSNSMITLLARRLSIHENCIQVSGTKDKRGITFQEVSAKCSFEKLFNYALALERTRNTDSLDCIKCRNGMRCAEYGFKPEFDQENNAIVEEMSRHMEISSVDTTEALRIFDIRRGSTKRMGDLDGNRFTINIRGLDCIEHVPKKFINYFGQQRFGVNLTNHIVGEHILKKRYDEAVDCIAEELSAVNGDRTSTEPKGYSKIQKYIVKMKRDGRNSKSIINSLSRGAKMIYLHAFQSYKFNLAVNERLGSGKVSDTDMVERNGVLVSACSSDPMDDILLPLEKMDDKLLKGGYRKVIECVDDFDYQKFDGGVKVKFFLKKSCYATMALRELIGDCVYDS